MGAYVDPGAKGIIALLQSLLTAPPDLPTVMDIAVQGLMDILAVDGAVIEVPESGDLVYRAVAGIAKRQLGLRVPLNQSLSGLSIATGQALVCVDSETDPRVNAAACRAVGLRSMAVIPLAVTENQTLVIKAVSSGIGGLTDQRMQLFQELATGLLGALQNAHRWKIQQEASILLYEQASRDSLTGIGNRSMFYDHARAALAMFDRAKTPFALAMMDLDGLKTANDTYGHQAGDFLLKSFADRLRHRFRKTDTIARLGGDEFGALIVPLAPGVNASEAMQGLLSTVEGDLEYSGQTSLLRSSFGVAVIPGDGTELEQLIEIADQRLYEHKRQRKPKPTR